MKTTHFLLCALAVSLLFVQGVFAQGKYKNVELTISHKDGCYQKHEQVEVYGQLLQVDSHKLLLTVTENGTQIIKKKPIELEDGKKTLILSQSYDHPVKVMLQVAPEGDSNNFSAVGFIVAPEEFLPGFSEPDDFVDYWQTQVAQMRKRKMKTKLTLVEFPENYKKYEDKVVAYDLEISMPEGNPVRAYIAWPKDAQPSSCGILITPHGSGVRSSKLNNAIHKAHSNRAIVIDINAHGVHNGQSEEYYTSLADGELKDYRTRKCNIKEDCYFRLMYLRMQRALDYACTLKLWDGKKVALEGTSQGGGQSAALAGIDPRVNFVILQVPALTDMGGQLAGHGASWPYYGKFNEHEHGDYMNVIPYYDAVNFLRHYKGTLIMEAGIIDTTCPAECVFAAFNVAGTQDKFMATYPYRQHGEKNLWEANYTDWHNTIATPRRERLQKFLKE